jgi:hypothetical protein
MLARGRWEAALQRLKRELDFEEYTYFQELRMEMEKEGLWDYEPRKPGEVQLPIEKRHRRRMSGLMRMLGALVEEGKEKEAKEQEEIRIRRLKVDDADISIIEDRVESNLVCSWR